MFPVKAPRGELVEIRGRGFGEDPNDITIVAAGEEDWVIGGVTPFHVLSVRDDRVLAEIGVAALPAV